MRGEAPVKLTAAYVPTNHVYLGDVLLLASEDIIHTDLTVAQGMGACAALPESRILRRLTPTLLAEVVVSMGMAVPDSLTGRMRATAALARASHSYGTLGAAAPLKS